MFNLCSLARGAPARRTRRAAGCHRRPPPPRTRCTTARRSPCCRARAPAAGKGGDAGAGRAGAACAWMQGRTRLLCLLRPAAPSPCQPTRQPASLSASPHPLWSTCRPAPAPARAAWQCGQRARSVSGADHSAARRSLSPFNWRSGGKPAQTTAKVGGWLQLDAVRAQLCSPQGSGGGGSSDSSCPAPEAAGARGPPASPLRPVAASGPPRQSAAAALPPWAAAASAVMRQPAPPCCSFCCSCKRAAGGRVEEQAGRAGTRGAARLPHACLTCQPPPCIQMPALPGLNGGTASAAATAWWAAAGWRGQLPV